MSLQYRATAPNHAITLTRSILNAYPRGEIERRVRRIVRSVRFELLEREGAMRILGPDMSYHGADPCLLAGLQTLRAGLTSDDVFDFRSRRPNFDLCLEDSWSGYFIAEHAPAKQDLILIHLDHHTDMMATLLERSEHGLGNPATGESFDPASSSDWQTAIHSGCVSIGNFVTPLYYLDGSTHVRHLNNFATSTHRLYNVTRESCRYDLIPDRVFAGIRKKTGGWDRSAGTYLGGPDARSVLHELPPGHVVVHIDLDYFINDFNGNPGDAAPACEVAPRSSALHKMERFFTALDDAGVSVAQWIVATSPGFCSARHWDWLLSEIGRRVEQIRSPPE
jgi:hypothetical protein